MGWSSTRRDKRSVLGGLSPVHNLQGQLIGDLGDGGWDLGDWTIGMAVLGLDCTFGFLYMYVVHLVLGFGISRAA